MKALFWNTVAQQKKLRKCGLLLSGYIMPFTGDVSDTVLGFQKPELKEIDESIDKLAEIH